MDSVDGVGFFGVSTINPVAFGGFFNPVTVFGKIFQSVNWFYLLSFNNIQDGGNNQDDGFWIFTCFHQFGSKRKDTNLPVCENIVKTLT
jgi:hypothetical protein